jgi:hypothetical protein
LFPNVRLLPTTCRARRKESSGVVVDGWMARWVAWLLVQTLVQSLRDFAKISKDAYSLAEMLHRRHCRCQCLFFSRREVLQQLRRNWLLEPALSQDVNIAVLERGANCAERFSFQRANKFKFFLKMEKLTVCISKVFWKCGLSVKRKLETDKFVKKMKINGHVLETSQKLIFFKRQKGKEGMAEILQTLSVIVYKYTN